MSFTYKEINPTLIPNTIMQKRLRDDVNYQFIIEAEKGYVLHDRRIDEEEYYPESTISTGNVIPRFKKGSTTVPASYDFTVTTNDTYTYTDENNIEITIPVVKIGAYEFYALPEDIVSISQISGGNIDYEIM